MIPKTDIKELFSNLISNASKDKMWGRTDIYLNHIIDLQEYTSMLEEQNKFNTEKLKLADETINKAIIVIAEQAEKLKKVNNQSN